MWRRPLVVREYVRPPGGLDPITSTSLRERASLPVSQFVDVAASLPRNWRRKAASTASSGTALQARSLTLRNIPNACQPPLFDSA